METRNLLTIVRFPQSHIIIELFVRQSSFASLPLELRAWVLAIDRTDRALECITFNRNLHQIPSNSGCIFFYWTFPVSLYALHASSVQQTILRTDKLIPSTHGIAHADTVLEIIENSFVSYFRQHTHASLSLSLMPDRTRGLARRSLRTKWFHCRVERRHCIAGRTYARENPPDCNSLI